MGCQFGIAAIVTGQTQGRLSKRIFGWKQTTGNIVLVRRIFSMTVQPVLRATMTGFTANTITEQKLFSAQRFGYVVGMTVQTNFSTMRGLFEAKIFRHQSRGGSQQAVVCPGV